MTIGRLRFITGLVILALVAAGMLCEFRARQVGLGPMPEGAASDRPAVVSPEYPASRDGDFAIRNLDDGRPSTEAWGTGGTSDWGAGAYEAEPGGERSPQGAEDTAGRTWRRWEKYEAVFDLSWTFPNPYDPDEIAVDALITTPSGAVVSQPCFWYVPCRRELVPRDDGKLVEVITPLEPGGGQWMLRYAPTEEGEHRYRLAARTPSASATSHEVSFSVRGAAGRGYLRVSRRDPRYFEFDDGSFFFAIGQNVAWVDHTGSVNFEQYMVNLSRAGANFARLWLTHFFQGQSLEWQMGQPPYHGLGFYSAELAWKLDRMLEAAESRGILLMWCLQHHGQFSTVYNADWATNPYRKPERPLPDHMEAVLGGPEALKRLEERRGFLEHPSEFFTHPRARSLFRRRMRYLIARYGYSTALAAWELWNEVRLTDGYSSANTTLWHREMGDFIKALDPTRRMVTTSYGSRWERDAYALPSHDFSQIHIYHVDNTEWSTWLIRSVDEQLRNIDNDRELTKPILIGEYGLAHNPNYVELTDDATWPVDPDGLHVHNSLWIGLFSGSAGTAMNWWWDLYIDRRNLYYHFTGIRRYLQGEDLREGGLRRVDLFEADREASYLHTPKTSGAALVGRDRAYGWAYQSAYTIRHFGPDHKPASGVRVELSGLDDGLYWAEFWNTVDGVAIAREEVAVSHGRARLTLPDFRGDLAFKLFRDEPRAPLADRTPMHDAWLAKLQALARRFGK